MAATEMVVVIAYDIAHHGVRRQVSRLLEGAMARVQKSVFEARMTRRAADRLFERASELLDEGDSLRMYVLTAAGLEKSRHHGGPPLPEEGEFWLL